MIKPHIIQQNRNGPGLKIGMCLKMVYNMTRTKILNFAEMLELYKLLGVKRIMMYSNYNFSSEFMEIVAYYRYIHTRSTGFSTIALAKDLIECSCHHMRTQSGRFPIILQSRQWEVPIYSAYCHKLSCHCNH